jgi:hypothetical protein
LLFFRAVSVDSALTAFLMGKEHVMDLELATVIDPTNIQCRVQLLDEGEPTDARYAAQAQEAGVVIRPCHIVVVDRARTPREIVWRAGTMATAERMDGDRVTYNDGYRPPVTLRFKDERPMEEQQESPITVGDHVLIEGSSTEELAVVDRVVEGRPAHPERLHALFPTIVQMYNSPHAARP